MSKNTLLVLVVLFGVLFCQMDEECFADAAAELAQANKYRLMAYYEVPEDQKSTYYGQAEQMYKSIVQNYPGTDTALHAQKDLVTLYILLERPADRQTALGKLKSDFVAHPKLPTALHWIARRNENPENLASDKYQVSEDIYQYIIDHHPDSNQAAKAPLDILKGQTLSYIDSGNDTAAEATIDKMITDFAGHRRLPAVLLRIADFDPFGEHPLQKKIYQKIIQHCPDSKQAKFARFGIYRFDITESIRAGNHSAVQTKLNIVQADFSEGDCLKMVGFTATDYYRRATEYEGQGLEAQAADYFQKAAAKADIVLSASDNSHTPPSVYDVLGDCYRRLGQYAKSIQCYQKLADDYPDYEMAWHALFMVGRNYQSMQKEGLISKSEANTKTKAAYQRLVDTHPDCQAAKAAQHWLDRNNSR